MIIVVLWYVNKSVVYLPINKEIYSGLSDFVKRWFMRVSRYTSFLEDSRFIIGRHEEGLN